jgi:hypothetical protein
MELDARLDHQLDLEEQFNKHNIDKIIVNEIDTKNKLYQDTKWHVLMECSEMMEEHSLSLEDMTNALWIEILRNPQEKHIQSIGTLVGNRLGFQGLESIKAGTQLIEATAHLDFFDLIIFDRSKIVRPRLELDKPTISKIEALMYQPPMICKPNDWVNNHDGGWLSVDKHAVLGKGNHHNQKLNLKCLNKLQEIPWIIDGTILFQFIDENEFKGDNAIFMEFLSNPFYFVWRYDKRGRMYSEGYNINLQSSEYRKAMISIDKEEHVTPAGMEWLKISVANAFGQDKKTFKDRQTWFNRRKIFDIGKADDPIIATKMLKAYEDADNGLPVKTNMFLDATASGMQVSAALSGCRITASGVNMIGQEREDIYDYVARNMNIHLEADDQVDRDQCKYPLMTHYYNSKERPKQDFNPKQLAAFYAMLDGAFPGAEDVLSSINGCWSDKDVYAWTLPDGHRAVIRSKVTEGSNVSIAGTEFFYEYTAYKASGNSRHLAPNVIHSIDGYIAREMVRRCDFYLAHIHDAFTCHPNYMDEVCDTYRVIMAEICESNLLQDILREITGNRHLVYKKLGSSLANDVLASKHMLS